MNTPHTPPHRPLREPAPKPEAVKLDPAIIAQLLTELEGFAGWKQWSTRMRVASVITLVGTLAALGLGIAGVT